MEYKQNWDLSQFLSEGSNVRSQLKEVSSAVKKFSTDQSDLWNAYADLTQRFLQVCSLVICVVSCKLKDPSSAQFESELQSLGSLFAELDLQIDQKLAKEDLSVWKNEPFYPILCERKKRFSERMPIEMETLAAQLSDAGFHANHTLYQTFMGSLAFQTSGGSFNLSQLETFLSHKDRSVRKEAFLSLENTLSENSSIFGQILNNILSFRLTLYKNRSWSSVLHESLAINRIQEESLNAMLEAIGTAKESLVAFLKRKQQLLGLSDFAYYDLQAPITEDDDIPYATACQNIQKQFGRYSKEMQAFAKHAIENGWIDSAPSAQKRNGGFCTEFPLNKESRILLTYKNTATNQMVLAHELGHAYHNHVLFDQHPLIQTPPMGIAESASTMAERLLGDGLLEEASGVDKVALLEDKIGRAVSFLMDLPSRFYFEKATHEMRKDEYLLPSALSDMMEQAQVECFGDSLSSWFPHFWCYKLHYYFTESPFYNWCYSFGYLFSYGVYAHLLPTGDFEARYRALLADTGVLTMEELGQKHLNANIQDPTFWQKPIDLIKNDIDVFLKITDK